MNDVKKAVVDHPVHDLIAQRWSPYSFSNRPVDANDLLSLFEAARWAPSSYNEQPWRFLVATQDDPKEFERLLSCLVEPNQAWAKHAPVLVLGMVSLKFARNGRPNLAAHHDLGLAVSNLSLEATARGLAVHQMIGILPDKAREVFAIPVDHEALTAFAIGYPGPLEGEMGQRDQSPRSRRPVNEFLFMGGFGRSMNP